MSDLKTFSGPVSNKVTAAGLAAAVCTLFWTIAAHTFWKTMSVDDLTVYITTSTVLLTAIIGFFVPESGAYTQHANRRQEQKQLRAEGRGELERRLARTKANGHGKLPIG